MSPADATLGIYLLSISISTPAFIFITSKQHGDPHHVDQQTTTVPALNKTKYGDIPLLTSINYNSWQRTVLRVLQEIDADEIISGEDDVTQPLDIDYKKRSTMAAKIISLPCSPDVKSYFDRLTAPMYMWETLKTRLDTSAIRSGRTTLLRHFHSARPKAQMWLLPNTPADCYTTPSSYMKLMIRSATTSFAHTCTPPFQINSR